MTLAVRRVGDIRIAPANHPQLIDNYKQAVKKIVATCGMMDAALNIKKKGRK